MSLLNKQTTTIISVEGMKCEHCAARVVNSLKEIKVKSDVDLKEKIVKVSFDDKKVTLEQIKDTINKLGFKAN